MISKSEPIFQVFNCLFDLNKSDWANKPKEHSSKKEEIKTLILIKKIITKLNNVF